MGGGQRRGEGRLAPPHVLVVNEPWLLVLPLMRLWWAGDSGGGLSWTNDLPLIRAQLPLASIAPLTRLGMEYRNGIPVQWIFFKKG